jgi:hypothetical protein
MLDHRNIIFTLAYQIKYVQIQTKGMVSCEVEAIKLKRKIISKYTREYKIPVYNLHSQTKRRVVSFNVRDLFQ